MGKHRNRNSKASHKKKHDARFRDKNWEYQRNIVNGNYDKSLSDVSIKEKIEMVGSPNEIVPGLKYGDFNKNVIGSIIHSEVEVVEDVEIIEVVEAEPIEESSTLVTNVDSQISSDSETEKEFVSKEEKTGLMESPVKSVSKNTHIMRSMKGDKEDMFIAQRVKRGMVFWYSVNSNVDKNNSPMIEIDGKKYQDSIEYGNRPWVVVSTDAINRRNRMCTIAPLSSSISNHQDNSPNKVHIYFMGRDTTILCEQLRTVNVVELQEYANTLTDEVMELVDEGIMYALGIKAKREFNSLSMNDALSKIDSVIEKVVQARIQKELENLNKGRQDVVDEMILKISDGFESLYKSAIDGVRDDMQKRDSVSKPALPVAPVNDSKPVESKNEIKGVSQSKVEEVKPSRERGNSDVDKAVAENRPFTSYSTSVERFYRRYPSFNENGNKDNTVKSSGPVERKEIARKSNMFHNVTFLPEYVCVDVPKKDGKIRRWTDELLAQFAYDFKYLPYKDIMVKWDIETEKKVIDIARKVERKLFTGDMNGKLDFSSLKISFPGGVVSYV